MKFKYFLSLFLMFAVCSITFAGETMELNNDVDSQEMTTVVDQYVGQATVEINIISVDDDVGSNVPDILILEIFNRKNSPKLCFEVNKSVYS